MYNIIMLEKQSRTGTSSYICAKVDDLFNLCMIFENSNRVEKYKVIWEGLNVKPSDYGWDTAGFPKWVLLLYPEFS